jgi:hypothetical protein
MRDLAFHPALIATECQWVHLVEVVAHQRSRALLAQVVQADFPAVVAVAVAHRKTVSTLAQAVKAGRDSWWSQLTLPKYGMG